MSVVGRALGHYGAKQLRVIEQSPPSAGTGDPGCAKSRRSTQSYSTITISTRRFSRRPSAVVFVSLGLFAAAPATDR